MSCVCFHRRYCVSVGTKISTPAGNVRAPTWPVRRTCTFQAIHTDIRMTMKLSCVLLELQVLDVGGWQHVSPICHEHTEPLQSAVPVSGAVSSTWAPHVRILVVSVLTIHSGPIPAWACRKVAACQAMRRTILVMNGILGFDLGRNITVRCHDKSC